VCKADKTTFRAQRANEQVVQFTAATNPSELLNENPWLANTKLVVKPDMLFGQRGKNDLVGLNLDFSQASSTWT
jgi:ATP citrate (pro-S)-lyase